MSSTSLPTCCSFCFVFFFFFAAIVNARMISSRGSRSLLESCPPVTAVRQLLDRSCPPTVRFGKLFPISLHAAQLSILLLPPPRHPPLHLHPHAEVLSRYASDKSPGCRRCPVLLCFVFFFRKPWKNPAVCLEVLNRGRGGAFPLTYPNSFFCETQFDVGNQTFLHETSRRIPTAGNEQFLTFPFAPERN